MRKYVRGELVTTLDEVLHTEFFWWHDKVYHRGWVMGWSLHFINERIRQKALYKAVRKEPTCQTK
jgi:hypothetical protein